MTTETASAPRRRWPSVLFGIVLLILGLAAVGWFGLRSTDTVAETFEGSVSRVEVAVTGDVEVVAGDAVEAAVEREWLIFGAPEVELTLEGEVLRVEADCGFLRFWCRSNATVVVPSGAEVVADTAAGSIQATGTTGGVDLQTSAGTIDVDVAGPTHLRTSAGSIRGTITDGDVDAQTSAGTVDLTLVGEFGRISAVSSAGSVELEVPDDVYRVDADTSAGSVDISGIATDPDATREIVARTSAGNITITTVAG